MNLGFFINTFVFNQLRIIGILLPHLTDKIVRIKKDEARKHFGPRKDSIVLMFPTPFSVQK